eukprot:UN08823
MLKRQVEHYYSKSVSFAKIQSSCDLFAFSDGYCDLATLSGICAQSGGEVKYYNHFNEQTSGDKFESELTRNLTRVQGWEAVIRVRVSEGFKVGEHYGNFHMRARNLVCSPCYHADQTMGVVIKQP